MKRALTITTIISIIALATVASAQQDTVTVTLPVTSTTSQTFTFTPAQMLELNAGMIATGAPEANVAIRGRLTKNETAISGLQYRQGAFYLLAKGQKAQDFGRAAVIAVIGDSTLAAVTYNAAKSTHDFRKRAAELEVEWEMNGISQAYSNTREITILKAELQTLRRDLKNVANMAAELVSKDKDARKAAATFLANF